MYISKTRFRLLEYRALPGQSINIGRRKINTINLQIKGSTKDLGRLRIQDIEIGKQSEICVEKDVNIKRVKTYNSNKACLG